MKFPVSSHFLFIYLLAQANVNIIDIIGNDMIHIHYTMIPLPIAHKCMNIVLPTLVGIANTTMMRLRAVAVHHIARFCQHLQYYREREIILTTHFTFVLTFMHNTLYVLLLSCLLMRFKRLCVTHHTHL